MTKSQLSVSIFCFSMLILGVICLFLGYANLGIYCNILVFAIQSILIAQQLILRNNNNSEDEK